MMTGTTRLILRCLRIRAITCTLACALTCIMLLPVTALQANDNQADDSNGTAPLIDTDTVLAAIRNAGFDAPVHVESRQDNDTVAGGIHVLLDTPFETLRSTLSDKRVWCEIIFLHFNIKACVMDLGNDPTTVSLYTGRLYYQSPDDAHRNDYVFETFSFQDDYLNTVLYGPEGPFGTRDYRIVIQAVPVDANTSLVHVSYSLRHSMVTRVAQRIYFASAGRHRIGFSLDDNGEEPVRGVRGMVERNTMRFYLALESFLQAPAQDDHIQRLKHWHALTEQYPDQLRELDLETYLDYKARERANQNTLQRAANEQG
ncbi:hypothetical protein K8B33_06710 [Alcanivorax sp. JB21]|uniref:hypothetical protein n=1 Tax=Alcanivorax limicola TaxID=2874102 RepID=UPI001CBEEFB7|nr:hypothetical protein [Alcanivorax limicola]MBZ2188779.1 hypothetical protein [Alcanivorax limicola]